MRLRTLLLVISLSTAALGDVVPVETVQHATVFVDFSWWTSFSLSGYNFGIAGGVTDANRSQSPVGYTFDPSAWLDISILPRDLDALTATVDGQSFVTNDSLLGSFFFGSISIFGPIITFPAGSTSIVAPIEWSLSASLYPPSPNCTAPDFSECLSAGDLAYDFVGSGYGTATVDFLASDSPTTTYELYATPEPSSIILLLLAVFTLGCFARKAIRDRRLN